MRGGIDMKGCLIVVSLGRFLNSSGAISTAAEATLVVARFGLAEGKQSALI